MAILVKASSGRNQKLRTLAEQLVSSISVQGPRHALRLGTETDRPDPGVMGRPQVTVRPQASRHAVCSPHAGGRRGQQTGHGE